MNIKQIEKTHTLQLDQSDCGVACLMSLIKLNGGTNSIEKLRELSGTTKQGTTMLGLYQVANQIGFTYSPWTRQNNMFFVRLHEPAVQGIGCIFLALVQGKLFCCHGVLLIQKTGR